MVLYALCSSLINDQFSSSAASKGILCILKTDLILFYDAPNTLFITTSTASKKTQVKEGVTRHVNHFST